MSKYGYCPNMEEYKSVEMIPINLLWAIRHIKAFRVGTILCVLFAVSLFLFFLISYEFSTLSIMVIFIMIAMSLNFMYNHTLKFTDVVNALNMDITNLEVEKLNTLRFDTISHGKFTLYYDDGGRYANAYYKMWITTSKSLPTRYDLDLDIWDRNAFYKRLNEEKDTTLSDYVTLSDVADIKSLLDIKFEWGPIANRIVATLDDRWLYSETLDILRTLKILRRIEKKLS